MGALLTVTHLDGVRESYIIECAHGSTIEHGEACTLEARQRVISALMTRHGMPYGCTCAAETDLLDAYPSIESAVEQITNAECQGFVDLDDEMRADLIQSITDSRCEECSVAILVLPFRQPLVVAPLHDVRCPFATVGPEGRVRRTS
jgi:hypothetical protein